ncbi:MAG TPA: Uma2 family endonuclease [Thermoanaerobaculia bacterium]|jgi:hypothetical protein
MDENRPPYSLQAPGVSPSPTAVRLPAHERFPHVDDHLDPPEVTRWERIDGRRLLAMPAEARHATRHGELDYVLRGKVAPGYRVASDLKTRFAKGSDFASDSAILKDGIDPATRRRHLEEIAFEVVSTQSRADVSGKAPKMIRRGLRRVFAIFLKTGTVGEWSPQEKDWVELNRSSVIADRCLIEPLEVEALFDAAAADDAVARGLVARGNRVIEEVRQQGRAEECAKAILAVLGARGLSPSAALRRRILGAKDLERLRSWLTRAPVVDSADEILKDV